MLGAMKQVLIDYIFQIQVLVGDFSTDELEIKAITKIIRKDGNNYIKFESDASGNYITSDDPGSNQKPLYISANPSSSATKPIYFRTNNTGSNDYTWR